MDIPPSPIPPGTISFSNNPLTQKAHSISSSKLKYFLIAIGIFTLIAVLSSLYLFWWIPQAQAKEFIEETSSDFEAILDRLENYKGSYNPLTQSFEIAKESFYEITTSRSYFEAVTDTKQDITDIKTTLDLVSEARKTKEDLHVPNQLQTFSEQLNKYYDAVEKSMKLLLEFEEFQLQMLNASGDEFNTEVAKLLNIYTEEASRDSISSYFLLLSQLAKASVEKFDQITPIPEFQNEYYNFMREYHTDFAETAEKVALEYEKGTDQEAEKLLIELSTRVQARNAKREQNTNEFVDKSPIKSFLEEALALENEINPKFTTQKEKYGLPAEKKDNDNIATPSATMEVFPSENPTPSQGVEHLPQSESSKSANEMF